MELVNEHMGALSALPVQRNAVEHGVGDNQKAGRLQLLTQVMDIEHYHSLIQIHIAAMTKNIQGTGGEQLQRQGNLSGLFLRLFHQLFAQGAEGRDNAGFLRFLINQSRAAVNDGLVLRANAVLVDLLHQRHDKLRFLHNRVVLAVTLHHIHGVQTVFAACGHADDCADVAAHRLHQRGELALRVTDENIIIGVEHKKGNQFLGREGLAGTGNAQQESRLVEQVGFVAHDKVMGNSVFSKVDAALVLNLLHLKGHEHRKALRSQGTERIDLPAADGQHCIQTVKLLEFQHRHLAHFLA